MSTRWYAPWGACCPWRALSGLPLQDLERSSQPVLPFSFLMQLREKYPQFAQQSNTGAYMQQDAEECWSQLLYSLRERLKVRGRAVKNPALPNLIPLDSHSTHCPKVLLAGAGWHEQVFPPPPYHL